MIKFVPVIFAYFTIVANEQLMIDFKCSHRSQRNHSVTKCEKNHLYHCLYDINSKSWREECIEPKDTPPGYHSVIRGQIDAELCPDNQFSPYLSWSNDGSECQYKKQLCNEEGQVVVDTGSNIRDMKCRCDYRHGYAYNVKPMNECSCSPSVEDCTCHLKQCQHNNFIISEDYICTQKDHVSAFTKCPKIKNSSENNSHENKKGAITESSETGLHRRKRRVSCIIVFVLGCLLGSYFCCEYCNLIQYTSSYLQYNCPICHLLQVSRY